MQPKTTLLTSRKLLSRADVLTSEEEKALRLRTGAVVEVRAPLARHAKPGTALAAELERMEIELLRQAKRRRRRSPATPLPSAAKDRIVQALRRLLP